MHARYFALLNLGPKLQFCGEASLEFPFNIPGLNKSTGRPPFLGDTL